MILFLVSGYYSGASNRNKDEFYTILTIIWTIPSIPPFIPFAFYPWPKAAAELEESVQVLLARARTEAAPAQHAARPRRRR